jgi:XTP/dITP diphosphohydrolase
VSRLLVATTNAGKQREFRRLLASLAADVVTPEEIGLELDVEEPFDTYAENATAKADAYARASGLLTLADDSGLEVAALNGGPGVRTGRWGRGDGRDAERMVEAVDGAADRRARMVCVLAVGVPQADRSAPRIELFEGVIDGAIARERRGTGGFGYDPVFELPSGETTAELPEGEKDRISHRGRAVALAAPRLRELLLLA